MIKMVENSILYILCPAYAKTGGPELLHQLVFKLNQVGFNAFITYYEYDIKNENYTPKDFKKYVTSFKLVEEIIDNKENLIVFPEIYLEKVNSYKNVRKVLWWMSVDNYLKNYTVKKSIEYFGFLRTINNVFLGKFFQKNLIYKFDYHFCQSYYAISFLNKKRIQNIFYLSDYINEEFFDNNHMNNENNVLYNPKKGYKFTKKIINCAPQFNWIPIQNLTTSQVKSLLSRSKVYIDFGNHPGKDRFPREACTCGCCIITGKKGSAKYFEDVSIPEEFKFENKKENIQFIIKKIDECLNDYDNATKKFTDYRKKIEKEQIKFEEDIKKIFNSSI